MNLKRARLEEKQMEMDMQMQREEVEFQLQVLNVLSQSNHNMLPPGSALWIWRMMPLKIIYRFAVGDTE